MLLWFWLKQFVASPAVLSDPLYTISSDRDFTVAPKARDFSVASTRSFVI